MDAFDEYRDNGAQIGVNGIAAGAIHRVAEHSCMYGIAKDIYGAAEIDLRFDVSRRFRCLKPLYQGGSHWNHFRHESFSDSRRKEPTLSHNRSD